MPVPLQITMRGMPHSTALEARIRTKAAALERFRADLTMCRVTVGELDRHHRKGRQFEVAIEVRAPGHADVVVTSRHGEDVYTALRDAFDAAARQVEEAARIQRGDVKTHRASRDGLPGPDDR